MRYSFPKALVASTFVMLIVSTMFAFIGWCSYTIPLAFLGILACSSLVGVLAGSFRQ
jgi:ABC-type multidrug transport system permease subunit